MNIEIQEIIEFYKEARQENPVSCEMLPASGSDKRYFRLVSEKGKSFLVSYNAHAQENAAFVSFTRHFSKHHLPIPELYYVSKNESLCLLQDLGNVHFLDVVLTLSPSEKTDWYKKALTQLVKFQFTDIQHFPFHKAYPIPEFNAMAMKWDLNYFKYNYLKICNIQFNELALEQDFDALIEQLLGFEQYSFMYRDFQGRNIMLYNNEMYFIDYQGGRKGNPWYDVVSILYQAKAFLDDETRLQLAHYYNEMLPLPAKNFQSLEKNFHLFALLRILQTMGAYGLRGKIEQKPHFISSLEIATNNLKKVAEYAKSYIHLPELYSVINRIF